MLSEENLEFYFQNGFLRIPQVIPDKLLFKLHRLFAELMTETTDLNDVTKQLQNGQMFVTDINRLSDKGNLAGLELLGFPPILQIAETVCGEDFFSVQEFSVIKELGCNLPVLWHQDMLHERGGNGLTLAIYLDDADEDDGALRVVPKSHLLPQNICQLSKLPFIQLPAKAGDVQIHDMLLAHSSEPLTKNKLRRVIYFEFLSTKHVEKENIYSETAVRLRHQLLDLAVLFYRQQNPEEKPFFGKNNRFRSLPEVADIPSAVKILYQTPVIAKPSAYCFESL